MKILLLLISVSLISCFARLHKRPTYVTHNGKKQIKLEVKYSSASDTGECTYWLKGIKGTNVHGNLRIIDTTGRYNSGDTIILVFPR